MSGQNVSHGAYTASDVPNKLKHQAVCLYHQNIRATEEIERLKYEMKNCVDHYTSKYECLTSARRSLQESGVTDAYSMGSISLLVQHIRQCEVSLSQLRSFAPHVQLETTNSSELNMHFPTLPQQNSQTCEISN